MPGFDDILGAIFGRPVTSGIDPLTQYFGRVTTNLARHATMKWSRIALSGITCHVPIVQGGTCKLPASTMCQACQRPTCLEHSFVSPLDGESICFGCAFKAFPEVEKAFAARNAPGARPPHDHGHGAPTAEEGRRKALEILGLEEFCSVAEIKAAYKKAVAKHHPDKKRSPEAKKKAEEQLKLINRAYELLMKLEEAKAA